MKTVIGAAVIVAALVPWQPNAHATTMVATDVEGQPLTRAACDKAGLAWNDNRNICEWEPTQQLASELITGAIASSQPLTRAACDKAGLEWNDNRNICNWEPTQQLASELITGAIASSQPLTRAACDKAGLEWNDNRNICNWEPTQQLASELITGAIAEIASKPQRATKQSTRVNNHTKREYTHTRQTQVVKSRPFPLFRLFRD
jgi:hypothetical protein